jgi:hypothetical protein
LSAHNGHVWPFQPRRVPDYRSTRAHAHRRSGRQQEMDGINRGRARPTLYAPRNGSRCPVVAAVAGRKLRGEVAALRGETAFGAEEEM